MEEDKRYAEHRKMMEERMQPPGFKRPKLSKMEKQKLNEAKVRLDAKYTNKPKNIKQTMSSVKEKRIWEKKRIQRYHEIVWKGWRISDK